MALNAPIGSQTPPSPPQQPQQPTATPAQIPILLQPPQRSIKHCTKRLIALPMRLFFFLLPLETAYTILQPYVQTKALLIVLCAFALFLAIVLPTREKIFVRTLQLFAFIHIIFIVCTFPSFNLSLSSMLFHIYFLCSHSWLYTGFIVITCFVRTVRVFARL